MFYYTSKVYNVVDRIFANAEVSVNSHLAILRDMQFEAQSAVQVQPTLKTMNNNSDGLECPRMKLPASIPS